MLQQTRAETVSTYYERFLIHFPTLESLASAPLDAVLKAWEGSATMPAPATSTLRRSMSTNRWTDTCRAHLKNCAAARRRQLYRRSHRQYRFGEASVALDGNLRRVLCVASLPSTMTRNGQTTQRRLEKLALAMIPPARAGDLNQGAHGPGQPGLHPGSSSLSDLPLMNLCQAQCEGIQNALPIAPLAPIALTAT